MSPRRRNDDSLASLAHGCSECTAGRFSDVGKLPEVPPVSGLDDLGEPVLRGPAEQRSRTGWIRVRGDRIAFTPGDDVVRYFTAGHSLDPIEHPLPRRAAAGADVDRRRLAAAAEVV